jgi:hypothetical protein
VPTFADLVESMSETTRERLLAARGASIDARKVLSASEQTLRVLCVVPRDRLAALSPAARMALDRLVPSPGVLPRSELGGGALALVEAGLAFASQDRIVCPAAIRLQLPAAPGEDPRSARALYSRLSDEILRVLHHGALRGRAGGPRPLGLGELLERVEDPLLLTREIEQSPLEDRRALAAIEARGGEVSRDGFLELTREPARYGGPGAGLPLRGTAQSLLASGYVVPVGHDRYVLPTEVARVVGRERREMLSRMQAELRARIDAREEDTMRARLALDPGPLAVALVVELMATGELGRPDRPVPRSAIARAARTMHVEPEHAELLVTLARAIPLRSARMREVGPLLVARYRSSGLGDETRLFPARPSRKLGATGIVAMRELVLDTLAMLPRGRFIPRAEVIAAALADLRAEGIALGLRELARTLPADVSPSLERALGAIASVSLPALGLVDVSHDGSLRLASRGARTPVPETRERAAATPPRWEGTRAYFDTDVAVVHALSLAGVVRAAIDPELVLLLDAARAAPLAIDREALASALAAAACPSAIALSAIEALPPARAVVTASDVVRWVPISDPELRERLLADPVIARDVVPDGPENGLLVHAHGTFPRLVRLFARHGVDLRKPA